MPAKHIQALIASRRGVLAGLAGMPLLTLASACASRGGAGPASLSFAGVAATNADAVTVPAGYRVQTLIAWGDALFDTVSAEFDPDALTRAEQEQRFGQNNDMLALFPAQFSFPPAKRQDRMILCVNHEYATLELMFPAVQRAEDFTAAQFEAALAATGICVAMIEREGGAWRVIKDSAPGAGLNRRVTPFSPVMFSGPAARHPWIEAAAAFVNARVTPAAHEPDPHGAVRCGTSVNCAGGVTPWGTYLSSEENFQDLFCISDETAPELVEARRSAAFVGDCTRLRTPISGPYDHLAPAQYDMSQNPHGPALYGWVVEIDPYDPSRAPVKRTALGRKSGECATTALTRDGRVAVYMGDDSLNEHVYKFVSEARFDPANRAANVDLLDRGALYAARFEADGTGRWLKLTPEAANAAAAAQGEAARFAGAGDVAMRVRLAADLLGATPMDRPEDVEAILDDNWVGQGPVLIVCTNNVRHGLGGPGNPNRESPRDGPQMNAVGHILRIDEAGADCGAESFTWDVFALAGDPDATELEAPARSGTPVLVSTKVGGAPTFSGARFACPDNICFDSAWNVWIATDGGDAVFADCNDSVLAASALAPAPRAVKRFLVGPVGAEICGPTFAPDETAFFAAIQHPGATDVSGAYVNSLRWSGAAPPSRFPDGAWPRSAVVVVTREDGGRVGT